MISIIICSANSRLLNEAEANIRATIGVPHEILSFENSNGRQGICELYNKGAAEAQYDILCYMHEDIAIKTANWGLAVTRIFNCDSNMGVVGVAGSTYKSRVPSGWFASSAEPNLVHCNYLQSDKARSKPGVLCWSNPGDSELAEVVCIDGMWFCTRKDIVARYPFDEQLLKGFHGYDIDFCLNVQQHYTIAVTYEILMEHFSEGGYNRTWMEDTLKIQEKWESSLPRNLVPVSRSQQQSMEKRLYKWLLRKLAESTYTRSYLFSFLNRERIKGHLGLGQYLKLLYYSYKYTSGK